MSNKFNYVLLILSILIFVTSVVLFFIFRNEKQSLQSIEAKFIYTNQAGNDLKNSVLKAKFSQFMDLDLQNLVYKNLSFTNVESVNFSSNFLNTDIFDMDNGTTNTINLTNRVVGAPLDKNMLYGTIYYSFYNIASLYYAINDVLVGNIDTCKIFFNGDGTVNKDTSVITDCDKNLKIFNINNTNCNFPFFFGSSPIADLSDNSTISASNGYICKGLNSSCVNATSNNLYNQNSMYWNNTMIYTNRPIYDYSPQSIGLYYTYPYFYPKNIKIDNLANKTYTSLMYSGLWYNSNSIVNAINNNPGSSYLWGQDFTNETQLFYNQSPEFYFQENYNNQQKLVYDLIGTENECLYTCNSDCLKNKEKYSICSCQIGYTNNKNKYKGNFNFYDPLDNINNESVIDLSNVLAFTKYYPENTDKTYVYQNVGEVKITITHKNYPNFYKSDRGKNFGALKYNGNDSLSSYKTGSSFTNTNSSVCGTGTSSINPFDFGETNIALDYGYLNLTTIPYVEASLQSNIQYTFQGGYSISCFVTDVTTSTCNIKIRNYPLGNLKSSSSLNGFQIYYNIYYQV